ncbi:Scr1 family TA system antitoxin-like transcriptional regulator [Nocardia sp. NPDC049737]
MTAWKVAIVPGLLQTPDYRRAIAWAESPRAAN